MTRSRIMEITTSIPAAVKILIGAVIFLAAFSLLAAWARGRNRNDIE